METKYAPSFITTGKVSQFMEFVFLSPTQLVRIIMFAKSRRPAMRAPLARTPVAKPMRGSWKR